MSQGIPYDSDEGRQWAASVTSLMTGCAYHRSAEIAGKMDAFKHFADNREVMLGVIDQHINQAKSLPISSVSKYGAQTWSNAMTMGRINGFRNSQATVLMPCGTVSFMMGCETTGVEPVFALVTQKKLAGGGVTTLLCDSVERGLRAISDPVYGGSNGIDWTTLIQDIDNFSPETKKLLETAIGDNSISPEGHLKMVAALSPLISGGISKTINLPNEATVEDIYNAYVDAWRMGIKGISVYRDGSKDTQVLSAAPKKSDDKDYWKAGSLIDFSAGNPVPPDPDHVFEVDEIQVTPGLSASDTIDTVNRQYGNWDGKGERPLGLLSNEYLDKLIDNDRAYVASQDSRKRMPIERKSTTHKFNVDGYEGYITAGEYPDGSLGEIFLTDIGKEGSTLRGMMNAWATTVSIALQYGVPLEVLARKLSHMHFAPEGPTSNPEIPSAHSIVDYIMRWLVSRFGEEDLCDELGILTKGVKARMTDRLNHQESIQMDQRTDTAQIPSIQPNYDITTGMTGSLDVKPFLPSKPRAETGMGKLCTCGSMMVRTGACYTCSGCGASTGCA